MFLRSTRRGWMIFNEADKGGGSSPAPAPAPAPGEKKDETTPAPAPAPAPAPTPAPAPAASTPAAEVKPTIVQKFSAMIADKSELLGAIARHEKASGELQGKLSIAEARIVTLERDLAEFEQIKAALKTAEEKSKSVEAAAADKIAALGFPADKLPPVTSAEAQDGDAPKTMEEFQKTHGELVGANKTEAASKFYDKFAQKFGL